MRGVIEDLKDSYGFISADTGQTYFFHSSEIVDHNFYSLKAGDVVQFTPVAAERGDKATKVQVVDSAG